MNLVLPALLLGAALAPRGAHAFLSPVCRSVHTRGGVAMRADSEGARRDASIARRDAVGLLGGASVLLGATMLLNPAQATAAVGEGELLDSLVFCNLIMRNHVQ
jgi:hypothetical protein